MISRGQHSHGDVVFTSTEGGKGDKIEIDVIVRYWKKDAMESLKMCKLTKGDGNMGFGIFVSALRNANVNL